MMVYWHRMATWQKVLLVTLFVLLILFISGMIHIPGDGGQTGPPVRAN